MTDRTLASIDYAVGDGLTDATDGLKRWFADLRSSRRRGLWCSGTYKVREGELVWLVGNADEPGPWIDTEPGTMLAASRTADAPIIEFRNSTAYRNAIGGYLGPLWFSDTPDTTASNRHGLALSGLQNIAFGPMRGLYLNGDVIHLPQRDIAGDPDGYQVSRCKFEGVDANNCKGWTFNNDNGVGFNLCEIKALSNILGGHGAFRGAGPGCRIEFISIGGCRGWAIDLYRNGGTPQRFEISLAEIDGPENGIRVKGLGLATIDKVRFVHRRRTDIAGAEADLFYPRTALSVGRIPSASITDVAAATSNLTINCAHRIQPYAGASKSQLGTMLTCNNDYNVADLEVQQQSDDNNTPPLGVTDQDLYTNVPSDISVRLWNRARVIHDGYPT